MGEHHHRHLLFDEKTSSRSKKKGTEERILARLLASGSLSKSVFPDKIENSMSSLSENKKSLSKASVVIKRLSELCKYYQVSIEGER
jgi:hypothetical protein